MNNQEWIPPIGRLFVRCQVNDSSSIFELCYRDAVGDQQHFRTICRIVDFEATPQFSGYVETLSPSVTAEPYNNNVYQRHLCRWDEVCAIQRLWASGSVTFTQWLEEVLDLPDLAEEEKTRFRRAYSSTVRR